MPNKEITVPVLPKPDIPNANGVLFAGDSLKKAIEKYMDGPYHHVMFQPDGQTGDVHQDVDLDKVCGSVVDITFNDDNKEYEAVIKLIPNKNSANIINLMDKGVEFTLGTNKMGTMRRVGGTDEFDEPEYPEDTILICDDGFDIISTSLLDKSSTVHYNVSADENDA